MVRRIWFTHTTQEVNDDGPSWLTFLGQVKESLWSVDLFRCESITLRSHWVLIVMDQRDQEYPDRTVLTSLR